MQNRRRHTRTPMTVRVKIAHPAVGEKIVKTKNISESGLFILVEPEEMPPIGEIVIGQVQGMIEDPPSLRMEIVRTEKDGIGLQFINDGDLA